VFIIKSVFLLPLRCILFLLVGVLLFFITSNTFEELSKWWTIVCVACNILTIAALFLICRNKGMKFSGFINYTKGKTTFKSVVITVLVMLVVGMAGLLFAGWLIHGEIPYLPEQMIQPMPVWVLIASVLLLSLTTVLAEDGLYLGVINQSDFKLTVALSAFFYAVQHSFIPIVPDFSFMLYRFISFLPLTVVMCIWYRKTKNPLPFMMGHFILNIATVSQIIMITASPTLFIR